MHLVNHSRLLRFGTALGGIIPALLLAATEPVTAPIPIEELFRPHAVDAALLSPDGKHLAATSSDKEGARSLLIMDLATGKAEVIKNTTSLDVGSFRWINDRELLFADGNGDQYAVRLFHAKLDRLNNAIEFSSGELTTVVGLPRARPNRALVWVVLDGKDTGAKSQLVEMSTEVNAIREDANVWRKRSTAVKTFTPPKSGIPINWLALENGELGYCVTYQDKKSTLHRYDAAGDRWIALDLDCDRYQVVATDPDQHSLWVSHYEADRGFLLQRFDPVTGIFADPVWTDPAYDLVRARLHFSKKSGQLVVLSYDQRRRFTKGLQEPYLSAQKLVQQKYPEADVTLVSHDDADSKLLYRVESPQDPGRIVLLDLTKPSLEVLSEVAPWLKGKPLLPTYPMGYITRDGLKEQGYLTLPAGASATHKVPLVVVVHDGPWRRDKWEFNPSVQFLASRGYAVLQPNYRGSPGYLPAISFTERYALRKMHEDVTAATQAAAALEMIDGHRLAIMGDGFGGFLALTGASLEPGLYSGAVSISGIFDWERVVKELSYQPADRGNYERLRDFLGQPGKDRETFAEYSPLKQAAAIKVPVFLAFDENPNVLRTQQAKELAATLKRQGAACETFPLKYSAYDLRGMANTLELYRRIEVFLGQHLGGSVSK
ncbi:MAG: hypothetical protein JWQ83_1366 [Lacunisphaera sp.]|nr:hypothetical protein [Lacunisphaera sp.]